MDGQPVAVPPGGPDAAPCTRLLLTVWTSDTGRWRARIELADGSAHSFESPFELARFVTRMPFRPAADGHSGLR
jgi:hypothetical protein